MEAVKIHGTKWTEIAKMWVASGQSARTAALWPKYPHQRTAGLLVARPHHTVGLRSTRLCSRGQPPLCVEPDACSQSHSSSLSLSPSLSLHVVHRPLWRGEVPRRASHISESLNWMRQWQRGADVLAS